MNNKAIITEFRDFAVTHQFGKVLVEKYNASG